MAAFVQTSLLQPFLQRGFVRKSACNANGTGTRSASVLMSHTLQGKTIDKVPTPVRNYVFAKRAPSMEETEGGVVLSGSAKEKPNFGTVVKTGAGGVYRLTGKSMPMLVKEGDSVVFGKYGGAEVEFDGAQHMFVDQFDLLCTLKDGQYKPESVQPLFDRVFVKILRQQDQTASGILLAPGSAAKKTVGEVVAVGTGKSLENGEYEPISVAAGDGVVWGDYVGTKLQFDRENNYIILRASDIFAKW